MATKPTITKEQIADAAIVYVEARWALEAAAIDSLHGEDDVDTLLAAERAAFDTQSDAEADLAQLVAAWQRQETEASS